ncbi:MAG TPA: NAD(P)-binding protein, partial [Cyclobacteriaceae bacterium]|nr:NAD(P)-binding protein [Cyclobacteriaceae bacterium]
MAAGAILLGSCETSSNILTGSISGPDMSLGHKLRELSQAIPVETIKEDIVIIGGGVAGLSAGRWLNKHGYSFRLIELENETGGNSRSGANTLGRYPLGAHYIPLPSTRHPELLKFLEECNVITGYENNLPVFNEYYLCFDPKERLFIEHHWQDGLIPQEGLSKTERDQIRKFHELMHRYREMIGSDGKFAFDIPVDNSSADNEVRKLDEITMEKFMNDNGLTCQPLCWYVNYCCADDFGSAIEETSAWAG